MELLAHPAHPYTRLLISAVPDPKRIAPFDPVERARLRREVLTPTGCPWADTATEPCSSEEPVFHRLSDTPEHWVRCGRYAPPADAPGTALELPADDEEDAA